MSRIICQFLKEWYCRLVHHIRDTSSKWYCWEIKSHTKGYGWEYDSSHHFTKVIIYWSLKNDCHLLNRIPSKTVTKTPYELWTGKSLSIRHLYVWGCPAEARPYIPYEKKLDLRTVSCLIVGYSERYIGFRFYCPSTKNMKTDNAKFFWEYSEQWESTI